MHAHQKTMSTSSKTRRITKYYTSVFPAHKTQEYRQEEKDENSHTWQSELGETQGFATQCPWPTDSLNCYVFFSKEPYKSWGSSSRETKQFKEPTKFWHRLESGTEGASPATASYFPQMNPRYQVHKSESTIPSTTSLGLDFSARFASLKHSNSFFGSTSVGLFCRNPEKSTALDRHESLQRWRVLTCYPTFATSTTPTHCAPTLFASTHNVHTFHKHTTHTSDGNIEHDRVLRSAVQVALHMCDFVLISLYIHTHTDVDRVLRIVRNALSVTHYSKCCECLQLNSSLSPHRQSSHWIYTISLTHTNIDTHTHKTL